MTGLYQFASRNKLKWNPQKRIYDAVGNDGKPIEAVKEAVDYPTGKVANIISMFERGIDGKEIAKKLRFGSYQHLADYMKSKGYMWDEGKQNYIKQTGMNNVRIGEHKSSQQDMAHYCEKNEMIELKEYINLLKMLKEKKENLMSY